MTASDKKQNILKLVLSTVFFIAFQQKALAYSAESTDALFKNIVVGGFFGIFIIVISIMVMLNVKKEKDKQQTSSGMLILKAIGVTILVFVLLSIIALSALGQL